MQIRTIALFAILATAAPMSAASAMTVVKPQGVASSSTVVHKTDYKKKKFYHKRNRYTPGGHYNKAPSNWHRYSKRPGDWHTRGCITVGPIWWCP